MNPLDTSLAYMNQCSTIITNDRSTLVRLGQAFLLHELYLSLKD